MTYSIENIRIISICLSIIFISIPLMITNIIYRKDRGIFIRTAIYLVIIGAALSGIIFNIASTKNIRNKNNEYNLNIADRYNMSIARALDNNGIKDLEEGLLVDSYAIDHENKNIYKVKLKYDNKLHIYYNNGKNIVNFDDIMLK